MGMLVGKRFVTAILMLVAVSILVFAITQYLPGDVAVVILGQYATPERVAAMQERLGLNRPAYKQYLDWAGGVLHGDFGQSLAMKQEILPILIDRAKHSAILALFAFTGLVVFGISFGIYAAVRRGTLFDKIITGVTYIGMSFPEFLSGSLLVLLLAGGWFNILPSSGYVSLEEGFIPWIKHLILPAITVMFVVLAYVMRMTRSNMLEVLQKDYIRTARMKGLQERVVIFKHALKNALMPTVTLLAINLGWLVGGIVVTESVFSYPGLGRLIIYAIHKRDIPLIQASILVASSVYVIANFLADLTYMYLNPKVRGE